MNSHPPTISVRRRGIAMVLVLMVVALATMMAWAVVASSNVGTQVTAAAGTQVQRKYLAESGLQLAMYYLQHPEASPVGLVYGPWGNVHYPGETNVQLGNMPGRVNITVTNTANGVFEISSTGTLEGDAQSASAVVHLDKYKTFSQATNFSGNITLGSNISITGGLLAVGSVVTNSANLVGDLLTGADSTLPEGTLTRYPLSMTHYLPYYFVNGKRYTAKRITGTTVLVTLLDLDVVNNPHNVWYTNQDVTFYLTTVLNGTVVTTNGKKITVAGTLTINPRSHLPALVSDGDLVISGNLRTLTSNGPTFIKNQIRGTGTTTSSKVIINGVLVSSAADSLLNGFNGTVGVTLDSEKSTFKGVMDEVEPIHAITVRSWSTNNRSF
jgi:hypothetical protein